MLQGKFKTKSGSTYLLGAGRVKRVGSKKELRKDGKWTRLLVEPTVEVGSPAILILEGLSENPLESSCITIRTTTEVVSIEKE